MPHRDDVAGPPGTQPPGGLLLAWRVLLVRRIVRAAALAAALPSALLLVQALQGGDWGPVAAAWGLTAATAWLGWARALSHTFRVTAGIGLLFGFACWAMVMGSSVALLYYLACPVLVALSHGPRPAQAMLFVCCGTAALLGWSLALPFPMLTGLAGASPVRWLLIATNLLMLGLLLTLSCNFLLRHLQRALDSQASGAQALKNSEQLLREVASQVPGMVFRVRIDIQGASHFLFVSPGSRDILGLAPEALMADASLLRGKVHPDDLPALQQMVSGLHHGSKQGELQLRINRAEGTTRWVQVASREVARGSDGVIVNGVLSDITARKATEDLVWRQAHFDMLTELPNRLTLQEELARQLVEAAQSSHGLALVLIDLDRFKEVNDTLGHAFGDLLLTQAGQRLLGCVRKGDFVARMGGDEFVVLLPAALDNGDIDGLCCRILAAMSDPFELEDQTAYLSASIGVALFPADGRTAADLLKHADQALYLAKDGGRDRISRFTPEVQARAQRGARLGKDLREAVAKGQMSLVYQPIVNLRSGTVLKAEALLRWTHPELGLISPAQFIPIAESTGQIVDLGEWVFDQAARQALHWRQALDPGFQISVNRSPLQFRAGNDRASWPLQLVAMGLPAEAVVVEITEGLLLDRSDAVHEQLRAFREAGMPISLDDFGTGYSAMAYLHRFPMDVLKIDRSFVSGEAADKGGRALCRAMVMMAHELGMKVVAEGIETDAQRQWLLAAGCDFGQGYGLGRPMPADDFERWWHSRSAAAPASGRGRADAVAAPVARQRHGRQLDQASAG